VITSGYSQALVLLGRAMRDAGVRRVAVEDPGVAWPRDILSQAGLAVRSLPVDSGGAQVGSLDGADGAAVLTPAHQYPLGVALRPERRAALVDWARQCSGWVIEDDYDGEFRYDRQPVGALQALDPGRVAYVGSAAKTLAPGLRLGWLAAPAGLLEAVVEAKRLNDRHSAVLDQLALAELIRTGRFDRHVRRMRAHYRRRRDALLAGLAAAAPAVQVSGIAAGLNALVRLPEGGPAGSEVVAQAARRQVAVVSLSDYCHRASGHPEALVAGYATPPEHDFANALSALLNVLATAVQGATPARPADR
jgi:GntR family transcriptional regulator / MocR family aminotransferase